MNTNLTIGDIAAELGMSKSTVSRAISGKGRISPATQERVRDYIREHNFQPNAMAQGLAQQRTNNIGVVCPTNSKFFDLTYFHRCLHGISDTIAPQGYDILLTLIGENDITNLSRLVENHKVDGVILTRTLFEDPAAEYLKECGMPFVAIGSTPDSEIVQVDNDHLTACCELTSVMLGKGYRRLALMGGDDTHIITDTRRRGFELAYEKMGLPLDKNLIFMGIEETQQAVQALTEILKMDVDGLICMDERITQAVLMECRSRHVRIPEDLRLASFYNEQALSNSTPAVTALDIDDRKLGAAAGEKILECIAGGQPKGTLLRNYQVILRESTQ